MSEEDISKSQFYITEIHPALSIWILLKDRLKSNELFQTSWKYKGDVKPITLLRRTHLIAELLKLDIVKNEIDIDKVVIKSDDELDAFVCWLMERQEC